MRRWVDAGAFSIQTLYGISFINEPFILVPDNSLSPEVVLLRDFYPKVGMLKRLTKKSAKPYNFNFS